MAGIAFSPSGDNRPGSGHRKGTAPRPLQPKHYLTASQKAVKNVPLRYESAHASRKGQSRKPKVRRLGTRFWKTTSPSTALSSGTSLRHEARQWCPGKKKESHWRGETALGGSRRGSDDVLAVRPRCTYGRSIRCCVGNVLRISSLHRVFWLGSWTWHVKRPWRQFPARIVCFRIRERGPLQFGPWSGLPGRVTVCPVPERGPYPGGGVGARLSRTRFRGALHQRLAGLPD